MAGTGVVETGEVVERTRVGIIGGSFFPPEMMEPLAAYFRIGGHDAEVIRGLPTQDPNATPEDHARALAKQIRKLGGNIILFAWSGGGSHVGRALEILEEEDGSHAVKLVAMASGSLDGVPKDDSETAVPRQPRNSEQFRNGIIHPNGTNDHFVGFDREMAPSVFFNLAPEIGRLLVEQMTDQYRVDASPMPRRLNTHWVYFHFERDEVRKLPAVLEIVDYYRNHPYRMDLRIIENTDHAAPITEPAIVWHAVMDYCVRRDIELMPPIEGSRTQGFAPVQRRGLHDRSTYTLPSGM